MKLYHRLFSKDAIRVRSGRATVLKGKMTDSQLREIAQICGEAGVEGGEIWSNGADQVRFSKEIPPALHQKIRNALFARP